MTRHARALAFTTACAVLGAADALAARETIRVGSKRFPENRLLAEIMAQALEAATDLTVERRVNLGGTQIAHAALVQGEIDLYPEYTGTGWAVVLNERDAVRDPLRVYLHVQREYESRFELTWLDPFGFSNGYALAVRTDVADRLGLETISDLAGAGESLVFGLSHEFLEREDGFAGLAPAYGLDLPNVRGMDHGLAFQAIDEGVIDVIDAWTTDGKLLRYDVRLLEDDRRFFPPYDCAPVARMETLARHPEIEPTLVRLAFSLSSRRMQELNHRVEVEKRSYEEVARGFLVEERWMAADGASAGAVPIRARGFLAFFWHRRAETLQLLLEHLYLTAVAVLLAAAVALPLGVLLTRVEIAAGPVIGLCGVLQTVPSLALLAFMLPVFGLGTGSALAALFLYALLPIVRNTYAGVRSVDAELVLAARAIGLYDRQILLLVQLPLATRTIMAGVRTSAVISVGVATLAAFIGAGGLGDPIVTGLQLDDTNLILSGAVPAALLAVAVDLALGRAEGRLAPRGSP